MFIAHVVTEAAMQVSRNSRETTAGPPDWYTADVYIDTVIEALAASNGEVTVMVSRSTP